MRNNEVVLHDVWSTIRKANKNESKYFKYLQHYKPSNSPASISIYTHRDSFQQLIHTQRQAKVGGLSLSEDFILFCVLVYGLLIYRGQGEENSPEKNIVGERSLVSEGEGE